MKTFLLIAVTCCLTIGSYAQDCSAFAIQGYRKDTVVSMNEAKRLILTSFAATNQCQEKLTLRSGSLYFFDKEGSIVAVENFSAPLDNETKLRLIAKLKPGMTLKLDEMHYGEAYKLVPGVSFTLNKDPNYLTSL